MSSNEKQRCARAICAALGFGASAAILTGEVARAQSSGLEEITVTARFREENLQETPLAITAFSGENMEARNLTDVTMLDTFSPTRSFNRWVQDGARPRRRSSAAWASATTRCRSSPAYRFTSTTSTTAGRKARFSICSTSSASRFCAVRKGRCSARTPSAGRFGSYRGARRATIRATRKSRQARSIASTCAARTISRSCRTSCSRASRGLRSSATATSTFSTSNA